MANASTTTRALVAMARSRLPVVPRSSFATVSSGTGPKPHHQVVIVGGGTAGVTVAAQLMREKRLEKKDIAIVEPSSTHHYQPGWTLVGSGLASLDAMRRPESSVIPPGVRHYASKVQTFDPENNTVRTTDGDVSYEYLVVAPGLEVDFGGVAGLSEALHDAGSGVSSIYSAAHVEHVWRKVRALRGGKAVFTQPAGAIKCAGAPQKIMWMALSQWRRDGVRDGIDVAFATGMPAMFAVAKYSAVLEDMRKQRGVEALFQHHLVGIDAAKKVATFKKLAEGGKEVEREYDFLHVTPPQKPWRWVADSPLADGAGWVDVDKHTTQHVKFPNVFSLGDASSLPNSKTAAAISAQAPVLVHNLLRTMQGQERNAAYDGYASCPLLTGHGELLLCEFKYGGVPKETFARVPGLGDQAVPRRFYYHVKKDVFVSLPGAWPAMMLCAESTNPDARGSHEFIGMPS